MDTEIQVESETIQSNTQDPKRVSVNKSHKLTSDDTLNAPEYYDEEKTQSLKLTLAFAAFTCISLLIGVLIVCFTCPKPVTTCRLIFRPTIGNAKNEDSQPDAIAVGDFNKDNTLDIVVANFGKDNIGIFIGNDNGTFESQVTYSTGYKSQPYAVIVNDFNNDNILDIVVANYGTNTIGIFFGKGNGTFINQTIFSTGNSRPLFISMGDFNNDNKLDLIVTNDGTNSIGIYLGNNDGTFSHEIKYFMGYDSIPFSTAVGDFNDDNILDLAIANYGTNNVGILFGQGNGTFSIPILYSTNQRSEPISITIGDLNNDHVLDLVVAHYGTHSIGIFYGYKNGSFDQQKLFVLDNKSRPSHVTIDDLNKDNQNDIVIVDSDNGHMYILPGYGNGSFSNLTTYAANDQNLQYAAAVGDFNHDNQSDIAVVSYQANVLLVLIGYSIASSVTQTQYSIGRNSYPSSIVVGDFNSDQKLDILVTKSHADSIGILFGDGNGNFTEEISYLLQHGSAPTSVCAGDFNNDNQTDVVVANYNAHNIGVLLGFGNGSFTTIVTYSTGMESFPIAVTIGDFNNDDILDIAVANFLSDNIAIFLGYGNGSFMGVITYSSGIGSDPSAIIVADFNHDKQLDIAVANSQTSNVGILFGNGDGSFRTVITYSTGFQSHPDSIIAGDLNHDTWLDIIIADSTSDNIAVLLGNEDGTFSTSVSYTDQSFSNPYGIVLADVNNDNQLDIIVTNFGTDNVGILLGDGNGSFVLGASYPFIAGSGPKAVVVGDFNNNTRWDIVVAETGIGSINLLVQYVAAHFQSITTYSTGIGTHLTSVAIGDFNNDNRTDIVVANYATNNVGIFLGYGNGTFTPQRTFFVGSNTHPQYVIVGDFNRDNQTDIATANTNNDSISVLLGAGDGNFSDAKIYPTEQGSKPYSIAVGDFNNDYVLDLVIANNGRDNIGILLGYDYNAFKNQENYANNFTLRPSSITSCHLNNDTYSDIAATFAESGTVGILLGYGNGTFHDYIMYSVGQNSYPYEIICTDVNNDHVLDIVVANAGSNTLGVLIGHGDGTFASAMTFSTGYDSSPYGASAGDFNNDNNMDFVVANYRNNSIGVLLGYGNGSFHTVMIYLLLDGSRPQSVAVGDFNQDNNTDIVVVSYRRDNMSVFIGNGNGTFQNQVIYSNGYQSMSTFITVHDFNNDTLLDVAVCNKYNDNVGIYYGFGNGTFAPVVFYSTGDGSSPHSIRSGDFNNDKTIDIAISSPGTNSIMILYGSGDGQFILGPSYTCGTKAGPISMAVGDFNGDGQLDITTANNLMDNVGISISYGSVHFGGVTTYSTGLGSAPSSVDVGDFNNDGYSDVVVANTGTNSIGIFLGHENKTFATMMSYSTGDNSSPITVVVGDLNHDNQSDIVVVNLQSNNIYIYIGLGDGTFNLMTTYSLGLGADPHGVTIGDFNNDGIQDIITVTAGTNKVLLLQGYGNGSFIYGDSYGLGYNYNPYAVAVADFNGDGRLDIAVANQGANYVEILLKTC